MPSPLVSIVIATRNRPSELGITLQHLRCQDFRNVQLIVIDDASDQPLENVVRASWPQAVFIRKEPNAGQCQRRNEALSIARGEFILHLDDDACFVDATGLTRAVEALESRAEVGLVTFHVFNGAVLPTERPEAGESRYCNSFMAGACLMRKAAIQRSGGYCPFFGNEWEEEEQGLKLLKRGWGLWFYSDVLIHHRVSPVNRSTGRTWMRGLRNKLWALVMHLPLRRLGAEIAWTVGLGVWDSIRLFRIHRLVQALILFCVGLPKAIALREPMSALALRRYDALRFSAIRTPEEFAHPPACTIRDFWRWFRGTWVRRARQRSIWDRRKGDIGSSSTVSFAHEYSPEKQ